MAHADTDNGHGQGGGRDEKLNLANRLKKKPTMTKEDLAVIGREMLITQLNVTAFREVLKNIRNRRIAQPFVRRSREEYLLATSMALALYYAAQIEDDPIMALKSRSGKFINSDKAF